MFCLENALHFYGAILSIFGESFRNNSVNMIEVCSLDNELMKYLNDEDCYAFIAVVKIS